MPFFVYRARIANFEGATELASGGRRPPDGIGLSSGGLRPPLAGKMDEISRMALRKKKVSPSLLSQVLKTVGDKLRGPLAIILGTPGEVFPFLADLPRMAVTCFEMDLYPAQRLREELAAIGLEADVVAAADLWDLPAEFQTVV